MIISRVTNDWNHINSSFSICFWFICSYLVIIRAVGCRLHMAVYCLAKNQVFEWPSSVVYMNDYSCTYIFGDNQLPMRNPAERLCEWQSTIACLFVAISNFYSIHASCRDGKICVDEAAISTDICHCVKSVFALPHTKVTMAISEIDIILSVELCCRTILALMQ